MISNASGMSHKFSGRNFVFNAVKTGGNEFHPTRITNDDHAIG